jgi:hypothetical protein
MRGGRKKSADRCFFHNAPRIHHGYAFAGFSHNAEIMTDEHQGHPHMAPQILQKLKDLSLDRHIKGRGWFIRHQQLRLPGKRNSNHDTLILAA